MDIWYTDEESCRKTEREALLGYCRTLALPVSLPLRKIEEQLSVEATAKAEEGEAVTAERKEQARALAALAIELQAATAEAGKKRNALKRLAEEAASSLQKAEHICHEAANAKETATEELLSLQATVEEILSQVKELLSAPPLIAKDGISSDTQSLSEEKIGEADGGRSAVSHRLRQTEVRLRLCRLLLSEAENREERESASPQTNRTESLGVLLSCEEELKTLRTLLDSRLMRKEQERDEEQAVNECRLLLRQMRYKEACLDEEISALEERRRSLRVLLLSTTEEKDFFAGYLEKLSEKVEQTRKRLCSLEGACLHLRERGTVIKQAWQKLLNSVTAECEAAEQYGTRTVTDKLKGTAEALAAYEEALSRLPMGALIERLSEGREELREALEALSEQNRLLEEALDKAETAREIAKRGGERLTEQAESLKELCSTATAENRRADGAMQSISKTVESLKQSETERQRLLGEAGRLETALKESKANALEQIRTGAEGSMGERQDESFRFRVQLGGTGGEYTRQALMGRVCGNLATPAFFGSAEEARSLRDFVLAYYRQAGSFRRNAATVEQFAALLAACGFPEACSRNGVNRLRMWLCLVMLKREGELLPTPCGRGACHNKRETLAALEEELAALYCQQSGDAAAFRRFVAEGIPELA